MKRQISLLAAALVAAGLTVHAGNKGRLSTGHADVGIAFEDDEWDLHVHDETNDIEYAPKDAKLIVGALAKGTIPNDPAYAFLGQAGDPIWVLPQVQNASLLFLGLGSEEIPNGLFANDSITFSLVRVKGPGKFVVYETDEFGGPQVFMNNRDAIDGSDEIELVAGSHQHVNWAFTKPGKYKVTFEAMAVLTAGGVEVSSGPVTYTFKVEKKSKNK
jgi:surface-anchored protein